MIMMLEEAKISLTRVALMNSKNNLQKLVKKKILLLKTDLSMTKTP
jgi:hypothetical protein